MKAIDKKVLTAMWRMWQGVAVSLVMAYGFAAANTSSCNTFIDWAFCMIRMIQQM